VEVAVSALRAQLGKWVGRARAGEEIVVTDRGVPVARLLGLDSTSVIERLTDEGLVSRPARAQRPRATKRRRVRARGSVSGLVGAQRR
jgi:prevent-host-death family protein